LPTGRSLRKRGRDQLWAYDKAIATYEYLGYEFIGEKEMNLGPGQKYRMIGKRLIYNSQ